MKELEKPDGGGAEDDESSEGFEKRHRGPRSADSAPKRQSSAFQSTGLAMPSLRHVPNGDTRTRSAPIDATSLPVAIGEAVGVASPSIRQSPAFENAMVTGSPRRIAACRAMPIAVERSGSRRAAGTMKAGAATARMRPSNAMTTMSSSSVTPLRGSGNWRTACPSFDIGQRYPGLDNSKGSMASDERVEI